MSPLFQGDQKMKRFGSLTSEKLTTAVCAAFVHSQEQIIWNTVEVICSPTHLPISKDLLSFTTTYLSQVSCCQSCKHERPAPDKQPAVWLWTTLYENTNHTLPGLWMNTSSIPILPFYYGLEWIHFKNQTFLGLQESVQKIEWRLSQGHCQALDTAVPCLDLGWCRDRVMSHSKRWCCWPQIFVTDLCICKKGKA